MPHAFAVRGGYLSGATCAVCGRGEHAALHEAYDAASEAGPLSKMFGPQAVADRDTDYRIRDLELRLDAVRAQRDEATQQLLDERATVSMLRRKLNQQQPPRLRADQLGYCDNVSPETHRHCTLPHGHSGIHQDSGSVFWPNREDQGPVVDGHGVEHNDMRDECGAAGRDGPCTRDEGHDGAHTNDVAIWMAGAQCAQLSPDELRAAVQEMRGPQ